MVSAGGSDYLELLSKFWRDFSAAIAETSELRHHRGVGCIG
jgi:DNA topoisomerase-1